MHHYIVKRTDAKGGKHLSFNIIRLFVTNVERQFLAIHLQE
jgi:hypothetical protein